MNTLNASSEPGMSADMIGWMIALVFLTLLVLTLVMIFAPRRRSQPKTSRLETVRKATEASVVPILEPTDDEVGETPMIDEGELAEITPEPEVEPIVEIPIDIPNQTEVPIQQTVESSSGLSLIYMDGTEIPLPRLPAVIGRSAGCTVELADESVSARHAEIFFDDESSEICLRDLDSLNGIWVNDQPTVWNVLQDGDLISLGALRLTFHNRGYTPPVGN